MNTHWADRRDFDGVVVLSLWDGARCTGTVRVAVADVPTLVEALQIGLAAPQPAPVQPAGLDIITGPGDTATG